jgi:hypothetical protein
MINYDSTWKGENPRANKSLPQVSATNRAYSSTEGYRPATVPCILKSRQSAVRGGSYNSSLLFFLTILIIIRAFFINELSKKIIYFVTFYYAASKVPLPLQDALEAILRESLQNRL